MSDFRPAIDAVIDLVAAAHEVCTTHDLDALRAQIQREATLGAFFQAPHVYLDMELRGTALEHAAGLIQFLAVQMDSDAFRAMADAEGGVVP